MRYVVGVDGGGTKTTAAVLGEDLGLLGSSTAGPANHRSVGMEAASGSIAHAVTEALHVAQVQLSQVAVVTMCLAGFDTDLDLPVPQRAVRVLEYEGPCVLENDVVGAWAGSTEAQEGVVVIAGTGATALGMNSHGELWRTDGWDYVLGDAGSGYAIGLEGIRAAIKTLDGRMNAGKLAEALGTVYGVSDADMMRRLVDSTRFGKFEIASFASHVSECAAAGDTAARTILAQAGRDLADDATAIIRRLRMEEDTFPVCTVGSVFKSVPWVTESFRSSITAVAPHATFRPPLQPPEVGAAIMGLNRLHNDDLGSWTLGTGKRHIGRSLTIAEVIG